MKTMLSLCALTLSHLHHHEINSCHHTQQSRSNPQWDFCLWPDLVKMILSEDAFILLNHWSSHSMHQWGNSLGKGMWFSATVLPFSCAFRDLVILDVDWLIKVCVDKSEGWFVKVNNGWKPVVGDGEEIEGMEMEGMWLCGIVSVSESQTNTNNSQHTSDHLLDLIYIDSSCTRDQNKACHLMGKQMGLKLI